MGQVESEGAGSDHVYTQRLTSPTHLTGTRGSCMAEQSKRAVVPLMTRRSSGGLEMKVRP